MDDINLRQSLRVPLYKLYYIDNIDTFQGLKETEIDDFYKEYSLQEVENIRQALRWGINNPKFDFKSLLPDLKHDNESIFKYICTLDNQLSERK